MPCHATMVYIDECSVWNYYMSSSHTHTHTRDRIFNFIISFGRRNILWMLISFQPCETPSDSANPNWLQSFDETRQWNDRNKPRSTTTFSLMDLFSISFRFVIYENIRTHSNDIIYFHKSIRMVWAHGRWSVHVLLDDYAMWAKRIGLTISISLSLPAFGMSALPGRWIGCEKWHETGVIVSSSAFVVSERVCSRVPNWCVKKDFNVLS